MRWTPSKAIRCQIHSWNSCSLITPFSKSSFAFGFSNDHVTCLNFSARSSWVRAQALNRSWRSRPIISESHLCLNGLCMYIVWNDPHKYMIKGFKVIDRTLQIISPSLHCSSYIRRHEILRALRNIRQYSGNHALLWRCHDTIARNMPKNCLWSSSLFR